MRYGSREPRGGSPSTRTRSDAALIAVAAGGTQCCGRRVGCGVARPPRDRSSCTGGDPFPARGLVRGDRRPRRARPQLAGIAAHSDDPCPSVAGGNQRIALELAAHARAGRAPLEPGRARSLGRQWGRRLRERGRGRGRPRRARRAPERDRPDRLRARAAGVASRRLRRRRARSRGEALRAARRRAAPTSAVLSVPERWWCWTATGDGRRAAGRERVRRLGARARRPSVAEGRGTWLDSLALLRPDLALLPDGAVLSTWDDDPWVRGAYSVTAPAPPRGPPPAPSMSAASTRTTRTAR